MPDVSVGEWSIPWNARDGFGRLGPAITESDFSASANEGIDQVGPGQRVAGVRTGLRP